MATPVTPGTFIPHDTASPVRARAGGGLNDLILLSAIVLFVASGALAVGVFLYGQFLQTESNSKLSQLQRAEAAFEPSLIQQLTRLDDRMHAADGVLMVHAAPTVFFSALEAATLQTVSFQTLDYQQVDPQHITVKMQGIAESVNSIALQADLFSKNGVITNPIFSNIARQPDGVHFDMIANVNPSAVSYAGFVSAAAQATPQNVPVSTPDTPSSPFGDAAIPGTEPPADNSQGTQ